MRFQFRVVLISAFVLLSEGARSQSTISMDSILAVIKQNNPMLKKYRDRAAAMRTYSQGAGAWMAPEAGGGLWMVPYKRVSDQRDKGQIMLSVQQKITNPAKLQSVRKYQESKEGIEEESESVAYNELRTAARMNYVQWVSYEKRKGVLSEMLQTAKLLKNLTESSVSSGQTRIAQVYKAEARIREIENMILENDNLIVQKNVKINQLMNTDPRKRFSADTTYAVAKPAVHDDSASWGSGRSDIRMIDKAIQSMRLNQAVENTQSRPDISLSFNHMIARGTGMPNQFMLLGMVSIPIAPWSSKSYRANVNGMDKEISGMQNEKAGLLNEVMTQSVSIQVEMNTLAKQNGNYREKIIPALKRNYETLMRSYKENAESLSEVLDALDALYVVRLQYMDTVLKFNEKSVEYQGLLEE